MQVKALGVQEVIVGDMHNPTLQRQAMQGVDSVYHICPNVHPDEISMAVGIIDAAADLGARHFVYHSVLHPQIEAMPHHWKKMRVEEHLFASGLPYTILQPAVYMQNVLASWSKIIRTGKYSVPYSVDSRFSLVDLEDVAEVAADILMATGAEDGRSLRHFGATYELVGTCVITPREMAAVLAEGLSRPVVAEEEALSAWAKAARNSGVGEYQIDTLSKMFYYYDQYGFWGNSQVLSCLLEHPPASFADFVRREIQAHSNDAH